MRGYFGLGQLSPSEKSDILDQHKQVYNGYKTMLPQVSNTQPLYVQDYANDKNGITVNNKGEVKHYMNFGINEQVSKESMCECGGMMYEGVCNECGSSYMEEETNEGSGDPEMCECGGMMYEGVCNECGSGYMEEETGHLDDIYNVEDFDPKAGFDYIEGSSNDVDTFEGMHKKLYEDDDSEEIIYELYLDDDSSFDFESKGPDEFGNGTYSDTANDMDLDKDDEFEKFNFEPEGPGMGNSYPVTMGNSYSVTEEGNNMDRPEITYDTMESAWMDEELDEEESFDDLINMDSDIESERDNLEQMESALEDEELDEVDVSGSQGIYADMKPAYDFDSGGAGPAGPYQRRNEQEFRPNVDLGKSFEKFKRKMADKDLEDGELDIDFDKFDPREKSWEEITDYTGDDEFGGVDEDIKESLITQKNRIIEMMNRMKVIK